MNKIPDPTRVYQPTTTMLDNDDDENSLCESESDAANAGATRPPYESTRFESGFSSAGTFQASSTHSEDKMRRRLQFFFMNPIEKWKARRKFPYKFFVQVIKIILVTMQLCLFAHSRYKHVNYTWDNKVTFSHIFLRGWDPQMEVAAYPPETGPLSVYVIDDFYKTIDFALVGYSNLSQAIGPYSYPNENNTAEPIKMCIYRYKEGTIFGFNESYIFNPEIDGLCVELHSNVTKIGSKQWFIDHDIQIDFSAFVKATLDFSVKTINFKAAGPIAPPDCYRFDIQILFDNSDHDGQVILTLDAEPIRLNCKGDVEYFRHSVIDAALRSILNFFVIIICCLSFGLCARALYRAQLLRIDTQSFFVNHFGQELSWDGKMEFLNVWYIMICVNDVLLILGSALKEEIERSHFTSNEWNNCSLLLGIGNLLVWFGVLRYLGFFKTYNVVILTLKRAAPKISRFLLCALLIYAGFTFCGWLILGPYHIKFRSLSTTSECLFALINGDDMFATFTIMSDKSTTLWWFCRIYLYTFISLYIYVVLSLFISVIMDAYDTIKKYYAEGFPLTDLKQFMGRMDEADFTSGIFRSEESDEDAVHRTLKRICCCCMDRPATSQGTTVGGYETLNQKASERRTGGSARIEELFLKILIKTREPKDIFS
ncbi:mucolipin-3-like isoform X3 [Culicoides brevitarsis]|uniref:mucolipin-3-like isoform X3 n=1 Tax=Culicoides brevitarsis TaxID=469753 RepID=UPI00307B8B5E